MAKTTRAKESRPTPTGAKRIARKKTKAPKAARARKAALRKVALRKAEPREAAPGKAASREPRASRGRRATATAVVIGTCLDLVSAGQIVQAAIPGGPHDVDSTLEDAGLITAGLRTIFRADVVRRVAARGCAITSSAVPNLASTTLRQARTAVRDNASSGGA